eukprot:GHUV01003127.1.p2 GENE.GHUV01003127.1~~GHUV01003127.1.p2  ORF type:complete len:118 (+),score=20.48 GHUV01003127.1:1601-1954(+)
MERAFIEDPGQDERPDGVSGSNEAPECMHCWRHEGYSVIDLQQCWPQQGILPCLAIVDLAVAFVMVQGIGGHWMMLTTGHLFAAGYASAIGAMKKQTHSSNCTVSTNLFWLPSRKAP